MLQKKISGFILDLKQRLGKGAYGEVYLAVDTSTNQFVAVKQIPMASKNQVQYDKTFALIQNEVKIMKSIVNSNVVSLINVQRTQNNLYLVMEYCNQGTLEEYIRKKCEVAQGKQKPKLAYLSEREAVLFIRQIVAGFRSIFQNKIVHRDLKLQNILIHDGEAKIADFGFSRVIECDMDDPLLRTYAGSPLYMSIQILKEQPYSSKCDIWSLGVIFYEILYGQPPWIAVSIPDLIKKIEMQALRFPDRPYVSMENRQLIQRMLTLDESQRIGWEDMFGNFSDQMEIEEEQKLKATVNRIEVQENDGLRRSNAKKKLYFENNDVLQNVQHAAKQQKRMSKIFNIPGQQQQQPSQAHSPLMQQQQQSQQSIHSQNTDVTRNRIFEQQKDRSVSPRNLVVMQKQLQSGEGNDQVLQIFQRNRLQLENKKIIQRISDWIIHRRNKSVFLNTLSQKWFDLYDNGSLKDAVNQATYYRFLFVLTKYQTMIFFKMTKRLELKYLDKTTKFTQQHWQLFVRSSEYTTTANQIKNDYYIVRGFLNELIERARDALEQQAQAENNALNKTVLGICNPEMVEKQVFDPTFFDNIQSVRQLVTELIRKEYLQKRNQEERNAYILASRDLLIFGMHLVNALRIKELFKFNSARPVDFFKYYQEMDTENPERWWAVLQEFK